MSNERIDLTQFEEIEARIKQCQKGFYPAEDLLQELAHHAPSLLAELKRCYEREDELLAVIRHRGMLMCPRSGEWFEWDYGCQSESCASYDDDCRELVEASQ